MRASNLDSYLRRPNPAVRAILICGFDETDVRDAAREALAALCARNPGDTEVVRLDDRMIAADPGRLTDEVNSYSLLGGRRIIHVRDADAAFAKAVGLLVKNPVAGNLVLAEATGLRKASPLRVLFEEADNAICFALPDSSDEAASLLVDKLLGQSNLTIESDARVRLLELVGRSSAVVRLETEKLALYCMGRGSISLGDIEAICGGGSEPAVDDLVLSCFAGDVDDADAGFGGLLRSGEDAGRVASAAHQHALRLADLRREVDRGISAEQAIRSARPPVFFKIQGRLTAELRSWHLDSILAVAASLAVSVRDSRSSPALASAIVGRALLAVARKARQLRIERA